MPLTSDASIVLSSASFTLRTSPANQEFLADHASAMAESVVCNARSTSFAWVMLLATMQPFVNISEAPFGATNYSGNAVISGVQSWSSKVIISGNVTVFGSLTCLPGARYFLRCTFISLTCFC